MRRPEPPGPLEYTRRWWLRASLAATFVFLYAPIVILVAFSFNDSRRNIVWQGFTFDYYVDHEPEGQVLVVRGRGC